jgi:hypothetical protein
VQDEYTTEMRAAAMRAGFAHNQIAAIFANAIAAERKRSNDAIAAAEADYTDEHSYDDADRRMMRDAERAEWGTL